MSKPVLLPPLSPSQYQRNPPMTCELCRAEGTILHHDPGRPDDPRRRVCAKCQGEINARIMGRGGSR